MPTYRRNRVAGGSYFFTVNLRDRRSDLLVAEIETLCAAVRATLEHDVFSLIRSTNPSPPSGAERLGEVGGNTARADSTSSHPALTRHPFHIDAWVVLPDHMHCVWTLPAGDTAFPLRWQMIKALFSRSAPRAEERRASLVRKREAGIWATSLLGTHGSR
jgi:putative transposase